MGHSFCCKEVLYLLYLYLLTHSLTHSLTGVCLPPQQVSTMTKNPYPLLDFIMLGPLFAFANIYFGSPLPEVYVAGFLAVSQHSVYSTVNFSTFATEASGLIKVLFQVHETVSFTICGIRPARLIAKVLKFTDCTCVA